MAYRKKGKTTYKRSYSPKKKTYAKRRRSSSSRSGTQTIKLVLQHEMLAAPRPVPVLGEGGIMGLPSSKAKSSKL